MTDNNLSTSLPLLVQGGHQLSFAQGPSEGGRGLEGEGGGANNFKGGWFTSKLGDTLLRGAGYFVTDVP